MSRLIYDNIYSPYTNRSLPIKLDNSLKKKRTLSNILNEN